MVRFEYRYDNRYLRRVVSMAELTEFLEGGRRQESNLPEGRLPVKFTDFVIEKYLPRCAKPNLKPSEEELEGRSSPAGTEEPSGLQ